MEHQVVTGALTCSKCARSIVKGDKIALFVKDGVDPAKRPLTDDEFRVEHYECPVALLADLIRGALLDIGPTWNPEQVASSLLDAGVRPPS
jgi:hypothetical protein